MLTSSLKVLSRFGPKLCGLCKKEQTFLSILGDSGGRLKIKADKITVLTSRPSQPVA
jgi:hypothetical protein